MAMERSPEPRDPALELAQARALAAGVAAGVLALPLTLYARSAAPDPVYTPLIASDGRLYYALALAACAAVGGVAARAAGPSRGDASAWALPATVMFAALGIAGAYPSWPIALATPILAGSGVFAALLVRYLLHVGPSQTRGAAEVARLVLSNVVGYVAFSVILLHHSRGAYALPALFIIAALLMLHWTEGELGFERRVGYALIVALAVAEAAWALGYFQSSGWRLGALSQAIWYGMAAVVLAHARGALNRAALARHAGTAGAVALAALLFAT